MTERMNERRMTKKKTPKNCTCTANSVRDRILNVIIERHGTEKATELLLMIEVFSTMHFTFRKIFYLIKFWNLWKLFCCCCCCYSSYDGYGCCCRCWLFSTIVNIFICSVNRWSIIQGLLYWWTVKKKRWENINGWYERWRRIGKRLASYASLNNLRYLSHHH